MVFRHNGVPMRWRVLGAGQLDEGVAVFQGLQIRSHIDGIQRQPFPVRPEGTQTGLCPRRNDPTMIPQAIAETGSRMSEQINTEVACLEVVQRMDETYGSLVNQQIELEQKNQELERAQTFIADILGAMTDILVICD
eukprot:gene29121-32653_t